MTHPANSRAARGAPDDTDRAVLAANATMLLTSVHHAYGAYVYGTPWRYHAVAIAAVTIAVLLGARARLRTRGAARGRAIARWTIVATIILIPILTIGLFEGAWNHVAKDTLYFGGLDAHVMARLFPPPTYEMPNDLFFEITGVLQVAPASLAALHVWRVLRQRGERPRVAPAPGARGA